MLTVAAFYHFAPIEASPALRDALRTQARAAELKGTILLALEGLNGTIAGDGAAVAAMVGTLRGLPGCAGLEVKYSGAQIPPFARMKVRLKREIITMGAPLADPAAAGTRVAPGDWNALIADPRTIVIDTRNAYETAVGGFAGAIDPGIGRFGDFPAWFDAFAKGLAPQDRERPIAMFCTGGIRCEKSTAYARSAGFADVRHLAGGILKYLEEVPAADSRWQGDCYVFDDRVALGQGLAAGDHCLCRACGAAVPDLAAHAPSCAGRQAG